MENSDFLYDFSDDCNNYEYEELTYFRNIHPL